MSNPAILTSIDHVDPKATPLNINELIDLLNPRVHSAMQGSYLPYVIQHDTPNVNDRDKAWIELDTQGRPIGQKVWWHGNWRRIYNGMLGEIRGFSGDPGYNTSGNFNPDGLGNVGGPYDGWHICNGKDGTPDFSNRFLVAADMGGSGGGYIDNQWKMFLNDGIDNKFHDAGGQWREVLEPKNIPFPTLPDRIPVDHWRWDDATRDPTGKLFGKTDATVDEYFLPAEEGNPDPEGVFVGPPFYAVAWIIFVGYTT